MKKVRFQDNLDSLDFSKNSDPVKKINIYSIDKLSQPQRGGPLYLRMGISERGYFKHSVNILQVVCKECSNVLKSRQDKFIKQVRSKTDPHQKLAIWKTIITKCKKVKKCPHCQAHNGNVKKMPNFPARIIHDKYKSLKGTDQDELIQDFAHVFTLNNNIESKDQRLRCRNLFMDQNLCNPIDLLITHIPAPLVPSRPSIAVSSSTTNEDDLNVKMAEIIQLNNLIKISIDEGKAPNKLTEDWILLQYTNAQYFNSETPGLPHYLLGNKQIRALSQRLKGKHGKTVISPVLNCGIDKVIIPIYIAKNLTFPERMNQYNIEKLRNLVRVVPYVHPENPVFTETQLQLIKLEQCLHELQGSMSVNEFMRICAYFWDANERFEIPPPTKQYISLNEITQDKENKCVQMMVGSFSKTLSLFQDICIFNYGMSIGISDITSFEVHIQEKQKILDAGYVNYEKLIDQYKKGNLVLKAGCNPEQTLESFLNGELSKIRDKAVEIFKSKLPKYNSF
ncbi:rna polymerase iii [Stylonychia lemnae]|uniref:DNA-directed RNA polymerase subunit n=1 Tax=Stylonychia lemnae TaxID=5949 RepID=A0A078B5U0_STYLE|nr:rna polymerase iii [Stylonychia lemnae]|eukprot:CDW89794.1 rna polymerase iii [Stylonychia lemnae]